MGFGKCERPLEYSPTLKACGCAVAEGWLAEGACGMDCVSCALAATANAQNSVKTAKYLAWPHILDSCIHDLRQELARIAQ